MTRYLFIFLLMMIWLSPEKGAANSRTGHITGQTIDAATQAPLLGANVMVIGTEFGAATDSSGRFLISNLPVGEYNIRVSFMGYETVTYTDIIVGSNRETQVRILLKMSPIETQAVQASAGFFSGEKDAAGSQMAFSSEEIRRSPGSAGDVSRILMVLPSVAKISDASNTLIIRGGSPMENGFYVDGIEIPNINHFPIQGSTGGPIGLINVNFIQDVDFSSGGFSVRYNDHLSSVMDIRFREGNRHGMEGQLNLDFAGFGGTIEGPISDVGSYLLSVRRSYLDLIFRAIDPNTTVIPGYSDYQGKIVIDVNTRHQISLLWFWGVDVLNPSLQDALDNEIMVYGAQQFTEGTAGLRWRALWSRNLYSNTSVAFTYDKFHQDYFETITERHLLENRSNERSLKFRHITTVRWLRNLIMECGIDAKWMMHRYQNQFYDYTDALGNPVPGMEIDQSISACQTGGFVHLNLTPASRFQAQVGIRGDYFSKTKSATVSPRISARFQITPRTALTSSAGIFYQNLPLILTAQTGSENVLKDLRAVHFTAGVEHLITENTRFTFEVYEKQYDHFPIDPDQPSLFVVDELFYRYGFFFNHPNLIDAGKAYSRGVECVIQKKMAKDIYGLVSASYFKTRYRAGDGVWRDRVFDNRFVFSIEGGYKPSASWEFSVRWIYAGGAPYTPFDEAASRALNRAVLDEERINGARYPDYHSLNIRLDRRWHFQKTNLIAYLSVWNAYGRKNVANYSWNEVRNEPDVSYQWGLLPILGLEYEF